jgi:hypothetical protein
LKKCNSYEGAPKERRGDLKISLDIIIYINAPIKGKSTGPNDQAALFFVVVVVGAWVVGIAFSF